VPPLEAHLAPYHTALWRVIEGQYRSSTLRLVDTFAEHDVLEGLLEASKPPVPEDCRHLDYQFWSPFRYGVYPRASRFRRPGRTPGVWYGSEQALTAICEMIWGMLRFFGASEGTPLPRKPIEYSAVLADIRSPFSLDLTAEALADQGAWTDPDDYAPCLSLADAARAVGGEVIRYASVRHPGHAPNAAVLVCRAFAQPRPIRSQTWHVLYGHDLVKASCETTRGRHMFSVGATQLLFAE
jgi:RES domain